MDYLDFDLLIIRAGKGYRAKVVNAPCGQATSTKFNMPFSELELDNFLLRVGRTRRGLRAASSSEIEAAKLFGEKLFTIVFGDKVGDCLYRSLDEANRQQAKGLRIRLRLDDAPEIADLPWEYLYNPSKDDFLALSIETPIVRYLDLPNPPRPLTVSPPLRILAMMSSPRDEIGLEVEQEWADLQRELKKLEDDGLVKLERLDAATPPALQRRLRQQQFHVFHFMGHGVFDKQGQRGELRLEDDNKLSYPASGSDLGVLLRDHKSIRLAVINACEGGRSSQSDAYTGIAQSLIRKGIPAVIAMQFEITDRAAITFAKEFYSAIVDGYPVDAALTEARKTIFYQGNRLEWGTPMLFLRSQDGHIFDLPKRATDDDSKDVSAARLQAGSTPPLIPPQLNNSREKSNVPGSSQDEEASALELLAMPGGPLDPASPFYIERPSDRVINREIKKVGTGVTIAIKGPRQVGKTSLLFRAVEAATARGKRVANVDFQEIQDSHFKDIEIFLRTFCDLITEELGLSSKVEDYWTPKQPDTIKCTNYVGEYILKELNCPLVLALDEVEQVFDTEFRGDFFSMLRGWHSRRARPATGIWKNLDLLIVTSTEPHYFIRNLSRSPFNVATPINLTDFTDKEVVELNSRYGNPLKSAQLQSLCALVGGHPYLVHNALYYVASGQIDSPDELFLNVRDERNPFRDYLINLLTRLQNEPEMVKHLKTVIKENRCEDAATFFRLHGAGLVRQVGDDVVLRCKLYQNFFKEYLHV
jgi:hypothetical protein